MQDLTLNWWVVILLIGAAQRLLLTAVLIFNKRGNKLANRFMAALTLLLVWHHIEYASVISGFYKVFAHFYGTGFGSWYLFGPLLYFYALILTTENFKFKKKYYLNFIPFIVFTIISIPTHFQSTASKAAYISEVLEAYANMEGSQLSLFDSAWHIFLYYAVFGTQFLHMFVYLLIIVKMLKKHSLKMLNIESNISRINLAWLRKLTLGFGIMLWFTFFVYIVLASTSFYSLAMDYVYLMPMTVLLYAIGFYAMNQPEVYAGQLENDRQSGKKYERSSLTAEKSKEYLEKLLNYMVEEKPYLNSELKLPVLAEALEMVPHHLSQVINEQQGLNFFEFVNKYRVEEAKEIIRQPKENGVNLLEVAFEVGFNNKASFNNSFKKHVGMTPSQYKKSVS